jgi:dicarboxylate transporter 10
MAACVTHPLDLGEYLQLQHYNLQTYDLLTPYYSQGTLILEWPKSGQHLTVSQVRLQTRQGDAPKNMSGTVLQIVRNDGILGLYTGLSASLLRQLTYSTARFGIYEDLKSRYTTPGHEPSPLLLTAMAASSGFVGGIAGNFADVVNVRMQHDASLPIAEQRQYKHAVDGVIRMAREEGAMSWLRGWLPNSSRAAAMTASQLASYDTFKRMLLEWTPLGDTLTTHFSASFLAGLVAATVTSPIDVIKTRVMSSANKQGIMGMIGDIYRAEGIMWMFKGWLPSFLRLGPSVYIRQLPNDLLTDRFTDTQYVPLSSWRCIARHTGVS